MGFGERVKAILDSRGIEQKALADRAAVPTSTLNAILRGATRNPSLDDALRIARVLGVSLDELADEHGPVPESPLNPYDTNPRYQQFIDFLEGLSRHERETVLAFFEWTISQHSQPTDRPARAAARIRRRRSHEHDAELDVGGPGARR